MTQSASRPALQLALEGAKAKGLLPPDASAPAADTRPWPVTLLTALGAWLAAIPLIGVVGLLLGDLISRGAGPYFVGALVLAGAVTVLRSARLPVFVEQLAVPALLVGGGALAFGLFRDLPYQWGAAVLGAIALLLAWWIERPWLRVLLGAAAAGCCALIGLPGKRAMEGMAPSLWLWASLHISLGLGLLAMVLQQRALGTGHRAHAALWVESVSAGWLLCVLAGLVGWSGMTFMLGGTLGETNLLLLDLLRGRSAAAVATQAGSVVLAAAAVLLVGRRWPSLQRPQPACAGLVLAALSFFVPALGAALLALAATATQQRWRLACAAAVAAVWMVGSFYYQLQWPLAHKAVVLVVAGAVLGALGWWGQHQARGARAAAVVAATAPRAGHAWHAPAAVLLTAAATLAMVDAAIWQKEDLIAHGDKVFVELAPVDPRSLMQGDFMRLNYRVPQPGSDTLRQRVGLQRPYAVGQRDARGVVKLVRVVAADAPLAPGEMRIELTPKGGRWILVSDAWFFREGDGQRWEKARYGEFRVAPDGRALLVGLVDRDLQAIAAAR